MDRINLYCTLLLLGLGAWMLIGTGLRKQGFHALAAGEEDRPLTRDRAVALWALLGVLMLLRVYRFGAVPGGFNQDGAMAAVDAQALARHGTDRLGMRLPAHFTAWGYGQMSVLLSYCMAPLFRLFGMNAVTARLPLLLASLLGMGAAYGLLRGLISRQAGLTGLLFLAVCPWHFMQSRWALDCNMLPHMFLTGLALLWQGTKKPAALYGSMVFFALCMYSYGLAFVTVPLFLLLACALLLAGRHIRPWQALLCLAIYFGLSWPIYGTMLINAMGWETVELPFVTMPFFPDSVRSKDLVFLSPEPWTQLKLNAKALWNVGFLQKPDLPWNAIDGFGFVYRCSWPLLALGAGVSAVRAFRAAEPRRRLGYRLLLLFWLCAIVTGLCVRQVNGNRINILFYAHVLLIAVGLHSLVHFRKETVWPLLACFALLFGAFIYNYFGAWAEQISVQFYRDFLSAVRCAGEGDYERLCITPDVQYTGSRPVSEILTLFELDIDAEYYRGETDETPAYRDRYVYRNPTEEDFAAPRADTAWVLKKEQLPEGLPPGWIVEDFGSYTVLHYQGG